MQKLIDFSLNNRLMVIILACLVLAAGYASYL